MIIANFIKGIEFKYKNHYFSGICFDSSKCKKDNIFFAIRGTKIDGNRFINHAIQKGAKTIISNQKFEGIKKKILFIRSSNVRKSLSEFAYTTHKDKPKNIIAVTGTNGKSTTAEIVYRVLKKQKMDVRLVGNIGNPILSEKNITKKTVFVIEASSYQLDYSKFFKSNISAILNISPDHLERHKTLKNYIRAKFKLIKNQTKNDYAILNTNNYYIKRELIKQKYLPKIIKINKRMNSTILKKINNLYFMTDGNKENLSFVLEIAKIFKIKKKYYLKYWINLMV